LEFAVRWLTRAGAVFHTLFLEKVMTLQFIKSALLAAFVSTSFSALAADRDSHMWLHPKLGYVKVQRSTPDAPKADAPAPAASAPMPTSLDSKPDADRCKPRYWLPPKGDMRRITPKGCR
jgi:hypothetical protein